MGKVTKVFFNKEQEEEQALTEIEFGLNELMKPRDDRTSIITKYACLLLAIIANFISVISIYRTNDLLEASGLAAIVMAVWSFYFSHKTIFARLSE